MERVLAGHWHNLLRRYLSWKSIKQSSNSRSSSCIMRFPTRAVLLGRGIQPALKHFYNDAEAAMKQQFAQVSVADVLDETLIPASQGASKGANTYRHSESKKGMQSAHKMVF
jgi:hypothetical protein